MRPGGSGWLPRIVAACLDPQRRGRRDLLSRPGRETGNADSVCVSDPCRPFAQRSPVRPRARPRVRADRRRRRPGGGLARADRDRRRLRPWRRPHARADRSDPWRLAPILRPREEAGRIHLRAELQRMREELADAGPASIRVVRHLAHLLLADALRLYLASGVGRTKAWLFGFGDAKMAAPRRRSLRQPPSPGRWRCWRESPACRGPSWSRASRPSPALPRSTI